MLWASFHVWATRRIVCRGGRSSGALREQIPLNTDRILIDRPPAGMGMALLAGYNTPVFPFERPKDYSEMLNKIATFTWIEAILLTFLVGHYVPYVNTALTSLKVPVKVLEVEAPVLYVVPGTVIAILARVFRLHDRISEVFKIRERFDVFNILRPLSNAVDSSIPIITLKENRNFAMRKVFYAYASFDEPKISKASVLSAIDTWTWYWVLLELDFLLIVTAVVFAYFEVLKPAIYILVAGVVGSLTFLTVFRVAGRKAQRQIDEITSDSEKVEEIRRVFAPWELSSNS